MKKSACLFQWLSVEIFFVFSVVSAIMFGVFSSAVTDSMHLSSTQLGWLSGTFFITYAVTQFYSGRLFILFSVKNMLLLSTLLAAIGAVTFGVANSLFLMFIARILLGIGLASTFVGVLFVIQNGFSGKSFPLMSSLSQSIANLSAGLFGFLASIIITRYSYKISFEILGCIFGVCGTLILLFFQNNKPVTMNQKQPGFSESIKILLVNRNIWLATVYFTGLFGSILTFADLFNVSFQIEAFHVSYAEATIINSMIPFGLTIGGIVAGYWAQKSKNYIIPARVFSLLAFIMLGVMLFVKFKLSYAVEIIAVVAFIFGMGCSGSILAFQCVQNSVENELLRPLATSFVLTFSYIFSGLIEQPLVGSLISSANASLDKIHSIQTNLNEWFYTGAINDGWTKYNHGLYLVLGAVATSFIASLFFKQNSSR
jgi:MFS family permease